MRKDNNVQNDIVLRPGQQAVFDKNRTAMAIYSGMDTTEINSWIYGCHVFNKTPFRDMIERLSHYYEKKITVTLPEILDYECTGKFRHEESLEHVLNVVKISKPFRYKEINNEIIIY
jgi:ferric-dicitrate binding protein FerR (iron transport regulator)